MPSINPTFLKYAQHYVWGLVASTFNGGIMGIGALAVMEEQQKLPEGITAHVLLHTFAVSCFGSAIIYFKAHPLPEKLPDPPAAAVSPPLASAAPTAPVVAAQ